MRTNDQLSLEMQFNYQEAFADRSPDAYETLPRGVVKDDATLFMRADLPKLSPHQTEGGLFAKVDDPSRITPAIEFRLVSLAYDEHVVLNDISFELRRGELLIVLSSSGGGKSTILKLTLGLLKPDASEILLMARTLRITTKNN